MFNIAVILTKIKKLNKKLNKGPKIMPILSDTMPKHSKSAGQTKPSISMKLQPTVEKNVYVVRLLLTEQEKPIPGTIPRDHPFIEKHVHESWGKDEDGKSVFNGWVTCPTTKYVRPTLGAKVDPKKYCPTCKYVDANFVAYKNSGWKDKQAQKVINSFKTTKIVAIPVYVVRDPHEVANNGKAKVILLKLKDKNDEAFYANLTALIKSQQMKTKVFNGSAQAVDLWISVKEEKTTYKEGTPEEKTYTKVRPDKIGFIQKPHEIAAITNDLVANFPYDEDYYTSSTLEELTKFYNDYVVPTGAVTIDGHDLNSMIDMDGTGESAENTGTSEIQAASEVNEELDGIDIDTTAIIENAKTEAAGKATKVETPTPKAEASAKAVEKVVEPVAEPVVDEMENIDLDSLIEGLEAK